MFQNTLYFGFLNDSKAPQYISKRLKPDGSQITCFPFFFFFRTLFHKKRIKFNWVFVPMRDACFFSKFSKSIVGKSLSFLASSCSYERMENIWRQCQGMLSCHFHVVFPWCERVSSCMFSPGKFPFLPTPSSAGASRGSRGAVVSAAGGSHLAEATRAGGNTHGSPSCALCYGLNNVFLV